MNSKFKTDLKAWLRKYSTPKEQQKHLFETFVREESAFEVIKKLVKDFLAIYGLTMHSKIVHKGIYVTVLQKLTFFINHDLMINFFKLRGNYNSQINFKNTRLKNTSEIEKLPTKTKKKKEKTHYTTKPP
jgi:hypothetical protein